MATIYLAGPLFTAAERQWNTGVAEHLRDALPADRLLVPQEFCAAHDRPEEPGGPDFAAIFAACVDHLDRSDIVIAVLDGPDPDSGTCWEAGYAYAKGIPVIGFRSDWRPAEDGPANCMLTRSCRDVVREVADLVPAIRAL